jgi:NAD(P)-dependent dehydrogenase (short-subunit alcohol dehydrogenase family)
MLPAIIVTGAAAGIGLETAIALGRQGRTVALCDIDEPMLAAAAVQVRAAGGEPVVIPGDLRDERAIVDLVRTTVSRLPLGGIVHSAGLFPQLSFAESELEDLDHVMAVNFRAAFGLAKAGVAAMGSTGGALVFLTSGAGLLEMASDPFQQRFSLYGASKAALDRWALGIAHELIEANVVVSTITPGAFVRTSGTSRIDLEKMPDLKEIDASAVGKAVAWLASEPRMHLSGRRLNATEFRDTWGE